MMFERFKKMFITFSRKKCLLHLFKYILSSEILFSHGYKCIRGTNEKKKWFLTVAISTCVPGLIFRNEFH